MGGCRACHRSCRRGPVRLQQGLPLRLRGLQRKQQATLKPDGRDFPVFPPRDSRACGLAAAPQGPWLPVTRALCCPQWHSRPGQGASSRAWTQAVFSLGLPKFALPRPAPLAVPGWA